MFSIMCNINTTSILYTGSHKSFPILCGNSLNCILLYCINYKEINICHLGIQKHVSYKKWCKCYKYFVYRLSQKFSDPHGEILKEVLCIQAHTKVFRS